MSTRARYVFSDDDGDISVYKHHDGYPSGAKEAIEKAKEYAWHFPRFEASEFSAAFVAANKDKDGGGVYLEVEPSTLVDYVYKITYSVPDGLKVECRNSKSEVIYEGSLDGLNDEIE